MCNINCLNNMHYLEKNIKWRIPLPWGSWTSTAYQYLLWVQVGYGCMSKVGGISNYKAEGIQF